MLCWARYLFIATVIGLGTLSMLGACGQKGPLYLPEPPPDAAKAGARQSDVPAVPPASASSKPGSQQP